MDDESNPNTASGPVFGDQPDPNIIPSPVRISYGGYTFDITPFLSRSQDEIYSGRSHQGGVTRIDLKGKILVDDGNYSPSFAGLHAKRQRIIDVFSTDYQTLTVTEDDVTILSFEHCVVQSVNFEPTGNGMGADYTIALKCYRKDFFANNYGILNPSDKTSYSYNDDGTISIDHHTSAVGIFTGGVNQPIKNAINWVDHRSHHSWDAGSLGGDPKPHFITGSSFGGGIDTGRFINANRILRSENKSVNRLDGSYSVDRSYLLQTGDLWNAPAISGTVSDVSTSVSSGINDDYVTISVDYKLKGDKNSSAADLRTKAQEITVTGTLYNIATGVDLGFSNLLGHNNTGSFPYLPDTLSIEDLADSSKEINISCDFISSLDLISGNGYTFDPSFSVDTDETISETTVSMNGTIKGIGPRSYRNEVASGIFQQFSATKGQFYQMANGFYTGIFGSSTWLLNPFPVSHSVKENKYKGTIDVSYTFNNKDIPVTGGFPIAQSANFNMTVSPSMQKFSAKPDATKRGSYAIYDLKVKTREIVDVSTTLNKYHEVDSAETPNFANDENVHDHFISGYVLGHTYGVNVNRNIEMVQGKTIFMDESWDIQGSPSNLVTRNSKISQKLTSNRQGTPFNG